MTDFPADPLLSRAAHAVRAQPFTLRHPTPLTAISGDSSVVTATHHGQRCIKRKIIGLYLEGNCVCSLGV